MKRNLFSGFRRTHTVFAQYLKPKKIIKGKDSELVSNADAFISRAVLFNCKDLRGNIVVPSNYGNNIVPEDAKDLDVID